MTFRKRRDALRSILSGSACVRPGSVYDAISIRLAEDIGFEVGMFGGSVASLAVIEAMKMQNVLRAERDGTVKKIHATAGATLAVDALILEFV